MEDSIDTAFIGPVQKDVPLHSSPFRWGLLTILLALVPWAALADSTSFDFIPGSGYGVIPAPSKSITQSPLSDPALADRIGWTLAALVAERAGKASQPATSQAQQPGGLQIQSGAVAIDAVAEGDPAVLRAELEALGLLQGARFGAVVSGYLPIDALPQAAQLGSLRFMRAARAGTNGGVVTSQGDAAMVTPRARRQFRRKGQGVMVGTLSNSFDCAGDQAAANVASRDLPADILVLDDSGCPDTDEGRAMMQLVHDVAPRAKQAFHTALGGRANFASGIIDLADAGARIIVDDFIYFAEPMYQDGIVAQAVDEVVKRGVAYFSSAGNSGRNAYASPFRPSGRTTVLNLPRGGSKRCELHDFDPGPGVDTAQRVSLAAGRSMSQVLQWDEPAFSASGVRGSRSDLDILAVVDPVGPRVITGGTNNNVGANPVEIQLLRNTGSGTARFNVVILHCAGPRPGRIKYVNFGNGVSIDEFDTRSPTLYGHANAVGAEAVGAAFYARTPAFGVNPPELEPFSSRGPQPIMFGLDGRRLPRAQIRPKPEITAPDGANTTFFGSRDADGDGFPNFFGTSAAAPHAAAAAALLKGAQPALKPAGLYRMLERTALPMADPDAKNSRNVAAGAGLLMFDYRLKSPLRRVLLGGLPLASDRNGYSDPGLFDPRKGRFQQRDTQTRGRADRTFIFGFKAARVRPLIGDWDGDGIESPGSYDRLKGVFVLRNSNQSGKPDHRFRFGPKGAAARAFQPIAGDWDGDGSDSIGLYNALTGEFRLRNLNSKGPPDRRFLLGVKGINTQALAGDWDGTGIDSVGLYNRNTGQFLLGGELGDAKVAVVRRFRFGARKPAVMWALAGDWDLDGVDTVGVYNRFSGVFQLRGRNAAGKPDQSFRFGPGKVPKDRRLIPLVGDWTGEYRSR